MSVFTGFLRIDAKVKISYKYSKSYCKYYLLINGVFFNICRHTLGLYGLDDKDIIYQMINTYNAEIIRYEPHSGDKAICFDLKHEAERAVEYIESLLVAQELSK